MKQKMQIVQCLCPQRHCICAALYDPNDSDVKVEDVIAGVKQLAQSLSSMRPWCGICGARTETWFCEARASKFTNFEEAKKEIAKNEAAQARTKRLLDMLGMSYDARIAHERGGYGHKN